MADQSRQCHGHAETRVITHCGEVCRQPRFLAGHAEIRNQRQAESGANGAAVDGGYDGFACLHQTLGFVIQMTRLGRLLLACGFIIDAFFQIGASAEMFAGGSEHDAAAVAVLVEGFERGGQLTDEIDIEKIVGRTAQFHCCDMSVDADADFLFSHGLFR